jgi:hypothetical protein
MPAPRTVGPNTKATVVDVSANSTTVYTGAGRLWCVHVSTVLSAHACPIQDNATVIASLAASSAVGTTLNFEGGMPFATSLIVNPDDAATGTITVVYEEG